jgi:hypothetical protein
MCNLDSKIDSDDLPLLLILRTCVSVCESEKGAGGGGVLKSETGWGELGDKQTRIQTGSNHVCLLVYTGRVQPWGVLTLHFSNG